jgi:AraC family transcriptional regulator
MQPDVDFIKQVPDAALGMTKVFLRDNAVLFKPSVYIGGTSFQVTDYHVVIPSEDTPEALFNRKMLRVEPKSVLTVNPEDEVVCLTNAMTKPYYSLLLHPEFIQRIAAEMGFFGDVRFLKLQNPFSPDLYRLFQNLECECSRQDSMNLLLDSLEIQIAVLLLRGFQTSINQKALPGGEAGSYVSTAIEFMRGNLNRNPSLADICREVHVSQYHFIRLFTRETGLTPHRYLLTLRIQKAEELLEAGSVSVMEAAFLCGFESASHFSATFKKMTGISPADWKSH